MAGDTAFVKGDIVEISCSDNSNTNDRHKQRAGDHHRIEDKSTSNNSQSSIDQSYVIMDDIESQYIELLLAILRREISNSPQDYKIIVFFPTGRLVRFMYQFFSSPGVQLEKIWEIHSRMSQSSRNRSSDGFRKARKGILFSSDVSQRGLDYPDVSLVVQYGAPRSRNDYVHRLGRTGRAGKAGKGVLVSMPFERDARSRRGIKLDKEAEAWLQHDNKISDQTYHDVLKQCRQDIESLRWKVRSQHATLTPYAESAVTSFLAHYLPRGRRRGADETRNSFNLDGRKALEYAKDFAKALGLNELPELDPRLQERLEG
jgi:ATP-dependent RNA helicase MSS116